MTQRDLAEELRDASGSLARGSTDMRPAFDYLCDELCADPSAATAALPTLFELHESWLWQMGPRCSEAERIVSTIAAAGTHAVEFLSAQRGRSAHALMLLEQLAQIRSLASSPALEAFLGELAGGAEPVQARRALQLFERIAPEAAARTRASVEQRIGEARIAEHWGTGVRHRHVPSPPTDPSLVAYFATEIERCERTIAAWKDGKGPPRLDHARDWLALGTLGLPRTASERDAREMACAAAPSARDWYDWMFAIAIARSLGAAAIEASVLGRASEIAEPEGPAEALIVRSLAAFYEDRKRDIASRDAWRVARSLCPAARARHLDEVFGSVLDLMHAYVAGDAIDEILRRALHRHREWIDGDLTQRHLPEALVAWHLSGVVAVGDARRKVRTNVASDYLWLAR